MIWGNLYATTVRWAEGVGVFCAQAWYSLRQLLLFTPEAGQVLLVLIGTAVIILAVLAYLHHRHIGHPRVVAVALLIPVMVGALLTVPPSFYGAPDDRCADYKNGKVNYELVSVHEEPVNQANAYGDTTLLMLVLAPEMWGDTPHLCRLYNSDERVQKLYKSLKKLVEQLTIRLGQGGESGHINFTFGNGTEIPNVTLQVPPEKSKKGPPELPPSKDGKDGSI